ncbi:hypothetical protein Cgig2_019775 [Carnegiea gigantea]|uniref:DUF4283 domain-containing protein n=1 Tax=Carnegiea gigantea TaxID=171969 RepID=A0A9Q1KCK7_9CARY|nr:hypothetical protein Cgig2_019775 [Carnegiea gigantea]
MGDKDYVLEEGPWAFDGHVLLLKELDIHEQPSKIEFTSARFWAYQIDILNPSKALKIKVDCDLQKPLRRGLMLKLNGTPSWFKMKYVKLPDFCYACSLLGHVYCGRELYNTDIPEIDLQYGSWLRATVTKKNAKVHEQEILQERHWLLELRDGSKAVKQKRD